jgi:hypothetical protein
MAVDPSNGNISTGSRSSADISITSNSGGSNSNNSNDSWYFMTLFPLCVA